MTPRASNGFVRKASSDVAGSDAISVLTGAFTDASARPAAADGNDRESAVISWPAVPIELVRAAGLTPVVVRGGAAPTPAADAHLESGAFPNRLRQMVEAVLTGRSSPEACLLLPRTSSSDYHCFLYLRELVRRGLAPHTGPILLFDLLQSTTAEVAAHNADRARALFAVLGAVGGTASIDRLREQIAHANAARAALRRLAALRGRSPRIAGGEVLPLIGAFWQLAPDVYAPLARAAADDIAGRRPLEGPRVVLLGAPIDGPTLHCAIEAHGAVVVSETGPWGAEGAGEDVASGGDPFMAIAEKYRSDASGPRTSGSDLRRRTINALRDVDAVVVSLPPDDAVFGWDYPWLREQLEAQRLPHVLLTGDPCLPLRDAEHDRLAALVRAAAPRLEARRG
jgi:benzoyl-CoA reductase/2-hydroxyglutaryl-CoA dehydratase subunit BcrC/BadD/HgdB